MLYWSDSKEFVRVPPGRSVTTVTVESGNSSASARAQPLPVFLGAPVTMVDVGSGRSLTSCSLHPRGLT